MPSFVVSTLSASSIVSMPEAFVSIVLVGTYGLERLKMEKKRTNYRIKRLPLKI